MNKRQLADKLREHRERQGLSQPDVARAVRVAQSQVSRWESAAALPSAAKIGALAQILGIDLERLYGWVVEASQDELGAVRTDRDDLLAKLEKYADRLEPLIVRLESLTAGNDAPKR